MTKQKMTFSDYMFNCKLSRRALYIESMAGFIPFILTTIDQAQEELNLPDDSREELIEWVIKDLMSTALSEQGVRVLCHYRWDEGKVIRDNLHDYIRSNIQTHFKNRFNFLTNTNIKAFLSGTDLILSVKISNES